MSIRDRGRIKWTSMMLPEHVKDLRNMWGEFDRESKPVIDSFTLSENEERIHYAMEYNLSLKFKVWQEFAGKCETFIGRVHHISEKTKVLKVECEDESFETVQFDDIVTVEVIE
jgi:hypothetical protein